MGEKKKRRAETRGETESKQRPANSGETSLEQVEGWSRTKNKIAASRSDGRETKAGELKKARARFPATSSRVTTTLPKGDAAERLTPHQSSAFHSVANAVAKEKGADLFLAMAKTNP